MSIWSRLFIGNALRPFMKPIPGDVAHRKLKPLVYAYVGLAVMVFNFAFYLSNRAKEGDEQKEETQAEYVHRVFRIQNPTIYKVSWEKGIEKEVVDTSKYYTKPDEGADGIQDEDDDILNPKKIKK